MARERELFAQQRVTELAKANEALRGCLDALTSVPELDDFLGQVMTAITRQLGAVASTLRVPNFEQNRSWNKHRPDRANPILKSSSTAPLRLVPEDCYCVRRQTRTPIQQSSFFSLSGRNGKRPRTAIDRWPPRVHRAACK